jgi:hypothetical protein
MYYSQNTPCILADVLNLLVLEGTFSNGELARLAGISDSKMSRVRNEESRLYADEVQRLAERLSIQGEYRVSRLFIHYSLEITKPVLGTANGTFDDEIVRSTVAWGSVKGAASEHDINGLDAAISELERCLKDAHAERNRIAANRYRS